MHPTKNYEAVADAIKLLGAWAHVQKSVWYVKSEHTAYDCGRQDLGRYGRQR